MPCSDLRSGSFTGRSLSAQGCGDDPSLAGRRDERRLPRGGDPALRASRGTSGRAYPSARAHRPFRRKKQSSHVRARAKAFASSHKVASGVVRRERGRPPRTRQRVPSGSLPSTKRSSPSNTAICGSFRGRLRERRRAARSRREKLLTGITRSDFGAPLRASARFSVGTRNTSAPEFAAPIAFCSAPPIGLDLAADLERARDGHAAAVRELAGRSARSTPRARTRGRPTGPRRRRSST